MGLLAELGVLSVECKDTADILLFFDKLFDSLNGSFKAKKRHNKRLLGPVNLKSPHRDFWKYSKNILSSMKFISRDGNMVSVPSLKNWIQTIENIVYIVNILLQKYNLTSVWVRHFNQDPLEIFFGCIRSHGYRNISPTCAGFEAAFASLLVNHLSSRHSPGSNCEGDKCVTFKGLGKLFFNKHQKVNYPTEVDFADINAENILIDVNAKLQNTRIRAQLEYVTGYILKKINVKTCNICKNELYNEKQNNLIKKREYFENRRCLTYPSHSLIECFSNIQDVATKILQSDPKKQNIKEYIKTVLTITMNYSFLTCTEHKNEIIRIIEDLSTFFYIFNWCKDTNKILNGSRSDYDLFCQIQCLAHRYSIRRSKI